MDSAANTSKDASITPKSSTTSPVPPDSPKNAGCVTEELNKLVQSAAEGTCGDNTRLIASGGYNDIWLVDQPIEDADRFVIRKPKEDALLPDQIRNEVACLKYVKNKLPTVPVPQVYDFRLNGTSVEGVFIAEEYIDGERLCDVWSTFDEAAKNSLARQFASIIVELGETSFAGIGGLMLDGTLGPTVEGMKLFKGRNRFHSSKYYNIGPFASTKQYVLACYDKEIYYYTHAPDSDIDWDLFETVSLTDWIEQLQTERKVIEQDPSAFLPEEPFVLVHGDLHGRNIMVKDGKIQAILDWEFAGAYPLSELLGGMGVDILEVEDDESADENDVWSEKIVEIVGAIARERGWEQRKVHLLVGNGTPELQKPCPSLNVTCQCDAQFQAGVTSCEKLNCSPRDYAKKQKLTSRICKLLYKDGTLNPSSVYEAVASATRAAVQATSTSNPADYKTYPPCARECVTQALRCDCGDFTNTACVCQSPVFFASVTPCERSTCSAKDLQATAFLAEVNCNKPGVGGVGNREAQLGALNATLGGPGVTEEQLAALNPMLPAGGGSSVPAPSDCAF
ncbi:MAG: hypothetical protein Q9216_003747 [Gyalolechia sp. 2 TL-2023]